MRTLKRISNEKHDKKVEEKIYEKEEDEQQNEEEDDEINVEINDEEEENKIIIGNENIANEINNYKIRRENEEREEQNQDPVIKENVILKSFYNNFDKKIEIFKKQKLPKKLRIWKDETFGEELALGEKSLKDKFIYLFKKKIKWLRPNETGIINYYIFKNKPDIKYIQQSNYSDDCYFLSALGAVCEKCKNTNFVKNLFGITENTKEKAYGVYFYINGVRQLILIDDYLAYSSKLKNNNHELLYSSSSEKSELWVSFIEKAWAKYKGGYKEINGGYSIQAFDVLTGAYTKQVNLNYLKKDKIWEILKENKDYLICAGTNKFEFWDLFIKKK